MGAFEPPGRFGLSHVTTAFLLGYLRLFPAFCHPEPGSPHRGPEVVLPSVPARNSPGFPVPCIYLISE
ncbi:hypothetical protein FJTKL_13393 [Diaporthe vaccinii]|uniref:Uncharacterized protein n=1 Tax=Diaporthe vaccinii TaxID=105482 RepID=A0ABR4EAP7_9PEZI